MFLFLFCNVVSYSNIINKMYCSEVLNKVLLKKKRKKKERKEKKERKQSAYYLRLNDGILLEIVAIIW